MSIQQRISECLACKGAEKMQRLTMPIGNLKAPFALITPAPRFPPTVGGAVFMEILALYGRVYERDFFMVPITFCETKMTLSNCRNCHSYVTHFLAKKHVKAFGIVGNAVYKGFFESGAIPELLCGRCINMGAIKKEYFDKQFFFFSDYNKLERLANNVYNSEQDFWHNKFKQEAKSFGEFYRKELAQ